MATDNIRHRAKRIPIECLRSRDYEVVEFYKGHQAVQEALGIDLGATIQLAKALPLGLRDAEHGEMRAALARKLASGKARLFERLPELVEKHFVCFDRPGRHDLLRSVCKPFVTDCMELLSGATLDSDLYDGLSHIFDPGIGPAKRKRLESLTKELFEKTRQIEGEQREEANLISMAVGVMGRDALLGSLAFSLYRFLSEVQGHKVNSKRFPSVPIDTGVPYVWRISLAPETEGEAFECRLDELVGQGDEQRLKLFGVGQHTCLGKTHSLKIFQQISAFLSERQRPVVSIDVVEQGRHVLRLPEELHVELG